MPPVSRIRKRWRPTIAFVVAGVCGTLISVPLLALLAVQLTSNQFVRETEQSLIQQSAIYAELYSDAFFALPGVPLGSPIDESQKDFWGEDFHPIAATLNVRVDPVREPRPSGTPVQKPVDPRYATIVDSLVDVARAAVKTNLSGVVFLDHEGRLLNDPEAPSLAELPEVKVALRGEIGRALRRRGDAFESHPLSSLSRDTGFRVFVTYPVIGQDRVVGAIYMSRTPLNLGKFLYRERADILTMLGSMIVVAGVIGWVLTRLISRPTKGLRDAAIAVAEGRTDEAPTLKHYGLRELASLGESVEGMAETLTQRSKEIATYTDHVTHELKSPVTAIVGAAELLQSGEVSKDDHAKLLHNIAEEGQRMNVLLSRLREMTLMRTTTGGGQGTLTNMLPELSGLDIVVTRGHAAPVPLTNEHGRIILLHMAQNAMAHNAATMQISWDDQVIMISDDGDGIDPNDIARVTEPFFTTRREVGGTGMGLAICKTILDGYDASFKALPNAKGAMFVISFL